MLINEKVLRRLVRKLLIEREESWLDDNEDEDFEIGLDEKEPPLTSYRRYKSLLGNAKSTVRKEISKRKDLENIDQILSYVDKTKLILVDKFDENASKNVSTISGHDHTAAIAIHVEYKKDRKPGEIPNKSIGLDSKKTKILFGEEFYKKWEIRPFINPIIAISLAAAREPDISLMIHELEHIKNNFFSFYKPNLNVEEVITLIRSDLVGKDNQKIIEILTGEGFFKSTRQGDSSANSLLSDMLQSYKGVFQEPPSKIAIDEFSVRLNALRRTGQLDAVISQIKNKSLDYNSAIKKYNTETAQVIPFLKTTTSQQDLDKIVSISFDNPDTKLV